MLGDETSFGPDTDDGFERSTKLYELYAKKVEAENSLVNQRTTWFIQLHAFLFASGAILIKTAQEDTSKDFSDLASNALSGLAFVGLCISFTTFFSVLAAQQSIVGAAVEFEKLSDPVVKAYKKKFPALTGRKKSLKSENEAITPDAKSVKPDFLVYLGNFTALALPLFMILCWAILAMSALL